MKKQKKAPTKKAKKVEKEVKNIVAPTEENEEVETEPKKIITAIEIDEVDTVSDVEEKPENEMLMSDEEDDSFSPDDEEIDPFGDKWEQ